MTINVSAAAMFTPHSGIRRAWWLFNTVGSAVKSNQPSVFSVASVDLQAGIVLSAYFDMFTGTPILT
ncbi:hypothetical protein [uncultured Tateyamaria sp.]|nr:hypothetical protein [uncultured Tateyamaria sp.]